MKKILCYGDSNTYGCNPEWTPDWDGSRTVRLDKDQRWTGILAERLGQEYEIIEEGLPGRTTVYVDPVNPYLDGRGYVVPCILSHSPYDLMVILLGTNDLKKTFSPTRVSLGMAMETLIKEIKNPYLYEHFNVPEILIVSPTHACENIAESPWYGLYDENSLDISKSIAPVYEDIAKLYGCHFLDAADYAVASPLDCFHMNPENHAKLATALERKVKEILG